MFWKVLETLSRNEFIDEVDSIAAEMSVNPKEIHIRKMKNKIASCSIKGRLTFDPSVLEMEKKERYAVIIHELLHLRYPTHTKMFKTLVESYIEKTLKINEKMENSKRQ